MLRAADALAELDVFAALADVAAERALRAARRSTTATTLTIVDGRHPVVEATLRGSERSCRTTRTLDTGEGQLIILLTGPEHGRQEHLPAPGGADRAAWRRSAASCRPTRRDRAGGPHLHARGRAGRPRGGPEHLHGGDDGDGQHPAPRHRAAAWSSWTRSGAAPAPTTAWRSPGRWSSTCTTRARRARPCSPPTTTS